MSSTHRHQASGRQWRCQDDATCSEEKAHADLCRNCEARGERDGSLLDNRCDQIAFNRLP